MGMTEPAEGHVPDPRGESASDAANEVTAVASIIRANHPLVVLQRSQGSRPVFTSLFYAIELLSRLREVTNAHSADVDATPLALAISGAAQSCQKEAEQFRQSLHKRFPKSRVGNLPAPVRQMESPFPLPLALLDVAQAVADFDTTLSYSDGLAGSTSIEPQQRRAIRRSRFKYQRAVLGSCNRIVAAAQRLRSELKDAAKASSSKCPKRRVPGVSS